MKFRVVALILSVALAAVAPVHAQGTHQFGIEGGTSVPSGDFSDAASAGLNMGGMYQFTVQQFGVGGEIKYHSWSGSTQMNAAAEALAGPGSEFNFSAMQYGVFGTYNFTAPNATPYLKVGFGSYGEQLKLKSPSGDTDASESNLGLSFGGGADFAATSSMKLGINAMYHRLNESQTDFFTVSARVMWPLKMTGI